MLSNAYFLAKFRFDTAENEPAKILQTIGSNIFEVPLETPMTRRLSHASAESVKEIKFHQSGHS